MKVTGDNQFRRVAAWHGVLLTGRDKKKLSGIIPYPPVMIDPVGIKIFFIVNRDKKIFKDLSEVQFSRFY
jgi:hypothetical protein